MLGMKAASPANRADRLGDFARLHTPSAWHPRKIVGSKADKEKHRFATVSLPFDTRDYRSRQL
jgi:hypothetical protein